MNKNVNQIVDQNVDQNMSQNMSQNIDQTVTPNSQEKRVVSFYNSDGARRLLIHGNPVFMSAVEDFISAYKNDPNMTQIGSDFESDDEYSVLTVKNGNKWRKLRLKKR
jgi:hypothetical protein